jgi:hypothetical protein
MNTSASLPSGVRRRLVPLLAALTVLAVLVGGGYALRATSSNSTPGGGPPPVLRLADYHQPGADQGGNDQLRLATNLPTGPDRAAVRWLTEPQQADVEKLAKALGIRGHVTRRGGATTYTTDTSTLRVQQGPGGQWQFVRASFTMGMTVCPPPPVPAVGDPDLSVSCDVAKPVPLDDPSLGTTTTAGPVTDSKGATKSLAVTTPEGARKAATPVFDAVGIDPRRAVVRANRPMALVMGDPAVADLATHGLTTTVTVSGQQVNAAGGWLGGSRAGATYPIISAQAAWDQLARTPLPRPLIGCPEPLPVDSDPMTCGGPITVTGAHFGLALHEDSGRPVLVPSWLFDVRDSDTVLAAVAVAPRYLAAPPTPTEAPGTAGSGSGSSTGSGGAGGSTGTTVPPDAPSSDPSAATAEPQTDSRFSSVTASGSDLIVQFTGGVHACFSYTVVPTETDQKVTLALIERTSANKRCVEMAQVYDRRVPLAKPLGSRSVVDARTGALLLGPSR